MAVIQNGMNIPLMVDPRRLKFMFDTTAQRYPPIRAPAAVPELKNVC